MMSGAAIQQLQQESSAKAARENKHPAVLFSEDTVGEDLRGAPWLGSFVHKNWEPLSVGDFAPVIGELGACRWKVEHYIDDDHAEPADLFVDKSGFADCGPALSFDELMEVASTLVKLCQGATFGIGIIEEGQFQMWLRLYRRKH